MDKIEELLNRGVEKIYPSKEELEKVLRSGKKLRVYQGFDPTGPQLHIGHMIGLRKLRQFQQLGHHVIFLIGDATVQAGDPAGKITARQKTSLIVGSHENKPGVLRKIAQSFEQEGINMTAIDSLKSNGEIEFRIKLDKKTPTESLKKVVNSLLEQGFFIEDESHQNARAYVQQAARVVNFDGKNPVEVLYNGDWLNKLTVPEILKILDHFTLAQISERDLFQERHKRGQEVNMREALYPILQAYDSVAMNIDLEAGGTDQTFNMLAGRSLVKAMQGRNKFVMTTPLLTDAKGAKIGKTEGNVIGITDKPEDLFGKIMALPDEVITKAFEYLTDLPMNEIETLKKELETGNNPVLFKKRLAFEIVKQLNDESATKKAQETFEKTVQKGQSPQNIPVYQYTGHGNENIVDLLLLTKLTVSRSEAKRLVEQGGVEVDGERIENYESRIMLKEGMIIQVGKRKFVRIVMLSEAKHPRQEE